MGGWLVADILSESIEQQQKKTQDDKRDAPSNTNGMGPPWWYDNGLAAKKLI